MANPSKRVGTIEPYKDAAGKTAYRGRIRLGDGTRHRFDVPPAFGYSEERARECVASMQEQEDRDGKILAKKLAKGALPLVCIEGDDALTDTAATWFRSWVAYKAARGQTSAADKWSHYVHHIRPSLGAKHVKDWTGEDLRRLVGALDRRVTVGELAWKTARNVWATTTKACDDARSAKDDALRVRRDDPTEGIEGPDGGIERGKAYLYPSEVVRFLACPLVPARWKRVVALAVYLIPRDGELRALRLADVDLEHGTIHVHHSWDRRARADKSTKSKRSRRFSFEPTIAPLLQLIADEANGAHVTALPSERDMARGLRRWLLKAGVTRAELHADTPTSRAIRFHDLRATGITWMAVRGDDPLKIMQRAGHTDFATTQRYVREAEAVAAGFGDVFPALPSAMLLNAPEDRRQNDEGTEDCSPIPSEVAHRVAQIVTVTAVSGRNSWRGGRDSNPRPPA